MLDYIVVGLGLSGLSICAQLEARNRTFKVIADGQNMASTVAGGVYNPVVLKRLTPTWNGAAFLDYALPFYRSLEEKLDLQFLEELNILRRFTSFGEQNTWYTASDKPGLSRFLMTPIRSIKNEAIETPFGCGQVAETGRVDVPKMLRGYQEYLIRTERLVLEAMDFDELEVQHESIRYKNIRAKRLILALGYRALESPWFRYLPIQGNKGEILVIEAPELRLETILKASDFVIPLGNHRYKVGATYNPSDLSYEPTEAAKALLVRNLERVVKCSYTVIRHEIGIRPTVPDRKPLVGVHPRYSNLAIINGMGSRGVLLAPKLADELVQHIEMGTALDPEIDINRYRSRYEET